MAYNNYIPQFYNPNMMPYMTPTPQMPPQGAQMPQNGVATSNNGITWADIRARAVIRPHAAVVDIRVTMGIHTMMATKKRCKSCVT